MICVDVHLRYRATLPCDLLLQIEAAEGHGQQCADAALTITPEVQSHSVAGDGQIGQRRWLRVEQVLECRYSARVVVQRPAVALDDLAATPRTALGADVTSYLMPSRYCFPEAFGAFVGDQFGGLQGGARIAAMLRWIHDSFTYDTTASDATTTASDSFAKRAGVCRDYAHVLIGMARSVGTPARYVSAYGPDVSPMDIHALVEVYLDGAWHLVDPTGMTTPADTVVIGVGRDAADVSFMTSFGWMTLQKQAIYVDRDAQ